MYIQRAQGRFKILSKNVFRNRILNKNVETGLGINNLQWLICLKNKPNKTSHLGLTFMSSVWTLNARKNG